MALTTTGLRRVFLMKKKGDDKPIGLPDPGPTWSADRVREFYCSQYPELANCTVQGPTVKDDKVIYEFTTVIAEKG